MPFIKIPKKVTYTKLTVKLEDVVCNDLKDYIKYLDSQGETEGLDDSEKESLVIQECIKNVIAKDNDYKKYLKEKGIKPGNNEE